MVKNRKPMFVSEQALARLKQLAQEHKCFTGDVVDILTGVKTVEEIDNDFQEEKRGFSKKVGRVVVQAADVDG